jgi:hypothetical protein
MMRILKLGFEQLFVQAADIMLDQPKSSGCSGLCVFLQAEIPSDCDATRLGGHGCFHVVTCVLDGGNDNRTEIQ